MRGRVLIVDDDTALSEMLSIVLRNEGYDTYLVATGDKAVPAFREFKPDLLLLDLMLPGMDGIDVCRAIRAESGVPIVMLTAKSDTVDVVLGLESGADDYVVKPFKPKELVARIRARLRRMDEPGPESLTIGDLTIDVAGHSVKRGRRDDPADPAGVRPAGLPGLQALAGVHPRGPARAGLGLPARGRHPAGQRARPAAAVQDREGPRAPGDRRDGPGRGLQGWCGLIEYGRDGQSQAEKPADRAGAPRNRDRAHRRRGRLALPCRSRCGGPTRGTGRTSGGGRSRPGSSPARC